jgi:hypothetical protein
MLDLKSGPGVQIMDEVGPFLRMMEKKWPSQAGRTVNNGLYFLQSNAKADLKKNKAGNVSLPPVQELKRSKGDYTRYLRGQKKGKTRNQKRALTSANAKKAGQYSGLAAQRKAERKSAKKNQKGLANAIRYSKYTVNKLEAAVGWVFRNGTDQRTWSAKGVYYQTGGTQTITKKMRGYFAGVRGVILKKGKTQISRPSREIWNNVFQKYVVGGAMERYMAKKLIEKINKDAMKAGGKMRGKVVDLT